MGGGEPGRQYPSPHDPPQLGVLSFLHACGPTQECWRRTNKLKLNPDEAGDLLAGHLCREGGDWPVVNEAPQPLTEQAHSLGV